jgi:hypothetical protein
MSSQPSVERSFDVLFNRPHPSGDLVFSIFFAGWPTEEKIRQWALLLEVCFFGLGQSGGLSGALLNPCGEAFSDFQWALDPPEVAAEYSQHGSVLCVFISQPNVDPGAVRVLSNVVDSIMCMIEVPVAFLSIGMNAPKDTVIERIDFPGRCPRLPFEVEEYDALANDFNVELVMARPYSGDELKPLMERISYWIKAVQRGGFGGAPYKAWEEGLQLNEGIMEVCGSSLILKIQQFYARPVAFDSLLNVLAAAAIPPMPRILQVVIAE